MEPYIRLNTEPREKVKTGLEKYFFKLMSSLVFGKSVENVRNRIKVELTIEAERNLDLINNPQFCSKKGFNDHLAAVLMSNTTVILNKPIYAG